MSTFTPPNPPSSETVGSFTSPLAPANNFPLGFSAGLAAALVGALVWAGVTYATHFQIGFMAVGVGFLVGLAVRVAGRGDTPLFGYMAGALALLGCLLGNIFTVYAIAAQGMEISLFAVPAELPFSTVLGVMQADFGIIDVLFYVLAIYYGYKTAFSSET